LSIYDNKKIVVTGGTGFLGSHIVDQLAKYNCKVYVPSRRKGVDLTNMQSCVNYFEEVKPDIVFNCAAHQGGIAYQRGREATIYLDNLLMGTYTMEAARRVGVKKYINVVAGCSYPGYLNEDTLDESVYWNGPLHESVLDYGFTKKAQVVQGWAYRKQYGFNSIQLILANLYGPRDHFDPERSHGLAALIWKIYNAKKNNFPSVEIWGTGRAIREWLYVEDAAQGILLAGEKYDEPEPLNIAVGSGLSIRELADMIKRIVKYDGEFVYRTDMPDGALKKVLGVERMKAKLRWSPQTPLEVGIKKTIEWLDSNYADLISKMRSPQ
jgi:GDP-L-fucose synthase